MSNSNFSKLVARLLVESCDTGPTSKEKVFSDAKFFRLFYREQGSPYFFLFKKNLSVTNIQFAELLALVKSHSYKAKDSKANDLRFVTTDDFRDWIKSVVYTFNKTLGEDRFLDVANLYEHILQRTIVCDPFFTSCSVFLPPELEIDLLKVCAYSGYIHSCGRSVFIRKTDKTDKTHLFEALDRFCDAQATTSPDPQKKIFFEVYAHEDFTRHDRRLQSDLSHGLDDVKIFVEKYHMGGNRLVSVIQDIREKYADKFIVPPPGDYRRQVKEKMKHSGVDQTRTLWLIKDQSIHSTSDGRHFNGKDSFYICYEQYLKNENPLHIFDENKPGWYSHTTIPHTLMGAMINVSSPWLGDQASVGDPFAGTGTTFLECLKLGSASIDCGDIAPLAEIVSSDNLEFFAKSSSELKHLERYLASVLDVIRESVDGQLGENLLFEDPVSLTYKEWTSLIGRVRTNTESIPQSIAEKLKSSSFDDRIIAYICLRAKVRGGAALERNSMSWESAVEKECKELADQIGRLTSLRDQEEECQVKWADNVPDGIRVFIGDYSYCCTIPAKTFAAAKGNSPVKQRDCRNMPRGLFDVVVSDPPYGFNTDDEAFDLGQLWSESIKVMLQSLKYDCGQLVLCLPDHTHIGRQLHFFTNKQFVTHQVLNLADELGSIATKPADIVPRPVTVFRPPYYWESERALRRSILHFVFMKRQTDQGDKKTLE